MIPATPTSAYQDIFNDLNNYNPELNKDYKILFHKIISKCNTLEEENITLKGRIHSYNTLVDTMEFKREFNWLLRTVKGLVESTVSNKEATVSNKKESLETRKKSLAMLAQQKQIDEDQQRILENQRRILRGPQSFRELIYGIDGYWHRKIDYLNPILYVVFYFYLIHLKTFSLHFLLFQSFAMMYWI